MFKKFGAVSAALLVLCGPSFAAGVHSDCISSMVIGKSQMVGVPDDRTGGALALSEPATDNITMLIQVSGTFVEFVEVFFPQGTTSRNSPSTAASCRMAAVTRGPSVPSTTIDLGTKHFVEGYLDRSLSQSSDFGSELNFFMQFSAGMRVYNAGTKRNRFIPPESIQSVCGISKLPPATLNDDSFAIYRYACDIFWKSMEYVPNE